MRSWVVLIGVAGLLVLVWHLVGKEPGESPPARDEAATPRGGATDDPRSPPTEVPRGSGAILGTVLRDGRPVSAVVELRVIDFEPGPLAPPRAGGPPLRTTKAGPDGLFEIEGLGPACYELIAAAADGAQCRCVAEVRTPLHRVEVEIRLPTGSCALRGIAVHPDGRPFRGWVAATGSRVSAVETDAEGRFVLRHLDPGKTVLRAVVPHELSATSPAVFLPREEEFRFVVKPEARAESVRASLSGRVLADGTGAPVAGVRVLAGHREAISGVDGRYELADLPGLQAFLLAHGNGWICRQMGVTVRLAPGSAVERDLWVVRAARAIGRVVDSEGAGLAGIEVRASPQPKGVRAEAVTESDGSFSLDALFPGLPYVFEALAPRRAPARAGPLVAASGETLDVRIEVAPARSIRVRVIDDSTGAPIADAKVALGVRDPVELWRPAGVVRRTDADGRATLGPIGAHRAGVQAEHPDYVEEDVWTAVDGPEALLLLTRGLAITGRVTFEDGSALPRGEVTAYDFEHVRRAPIRDGDFRVGGLTPRRWDLRVKVVREDGEYIAFEEAKAGQEDVRLVLERSEVRRQDLVVRLQDPEGRPVVGGTVVTNTMYLPHAWDISVGGTVVSDAMHLPHCWDVSAGGEAALAVHPDDEPVRLAAFGATSADGTPLGAAYLGSHRVADRPVTVRLPPERTIAGRVRGPDGRGEPGIRVAASAVYPDPPGPRFPNPAHAEAVTDAQGAFHLGGLGDFAYELRVSPPPRFAPVEPVKVRAGATGVEIALEASATARLTVLDWEGRPLPHARILAGYRIEAVTDVDGVVRLTGLSPSDRFWVLVRPPLFRDDLDEQILDDWRPRDETIRLERRYVVAGVVVDSAGLAVRGATVRLRQGRSYPEIVTDREGRFRFTRLHAGTVSLTVKTEERHYDETGVGRVTVSAGKEDVVLRLSEGRTLTVRVANWSADYRASALLLAPKRGMFGSHRLPVAADGTVRFEGLQPGATYALWIGPVERDLHVYVKKIDLTVAWLDVRLVKGKSITGRITMTEKGENPTIWAHCRLFVVHGTIRPDGTYEIRGLPDGNWLVIAGADVVERYGHLRARVTVRAGTVKDIVLKRAW